jgi:hypothetical protein
MTPEPTHCPRCHSQQSFVSHLRELADRPWKEIYIVCRMCQWESVIGHTTDEIDMLRMRYMGLRRRSAYEASQHGQASSSTRRSMVEMARRYMNAKIKLEQDVKAIDGRR